MKYLQKKRFFLVCASCCFITGLAFIFLSYFSDNITFFVKPSEILENAAHQNKFVRLGGVVKKNTLKPDLKNESLLFDLMDHKKIITVYHKGILPSLFREGQTIIAEGQYNTKKKIFIASKVLAKHDETYKPPTL